MHSWPDTAPASEALLSGSVPESDIERLASSLGDADGARAAVEAASRFARQVQRDDENTRSLRDHANKEQCFFCTIAEEPRDIHDLESLSGIAHALVADVEVAHA